MSKAGLPWTKIREITGRGNGAISKTLKTTSTSLQAGSSAGRPRAITPQLYKILEKLAAQLQKTSNGLQEVLSLIHI